LIVSRIDCTKRACSIASSSTRWGIVHQTKAVALSALFMLFDGDVGVREKLAASGSQVGQLRLLNPQDGDGVRSLPCEGVPDEDLRGVLRPAGGESADGVR